MRKLTLCILIFIFFGCENIIVEPSELALGKWGGEQIVMNVSESQINFSWGCAFGEINEKVTLKDGKMNVIGQYKRGMGIMPADPALWPKWQPARFEGILRGKTLAIKVVLIDGNIDLGDFAVTLGQEEKIFYCL